MQDEEPFIMEDVRLSPLPPLPAPARRGKPAPTADEEGDDCVEESDASRGVVGRLMALRNSLSPEMIKVAQSRLRKESARRLDKESRAAGVDLDLLRDLMTVFDHVGADSKKGVSEAQFIETFAAALCPGMDDAQVRCWFRRIDSQCCGRISWPEIADYITQRTDENGSDDETLGTENHFANRYEPEVIEGSCQRHAAHNGQMLSTCYIASTDALFSSGSDHVVRNWNPVSLAANVTPVHIGTSRIVGLACIPQGSRLCVFETNRIVTIYDTSASKKDDGRDSRRSSPHRSAPMAHAHQNPAVQGTTDAAKTAFCKAYAAPGPHVTASASGAACVVRTANAKARIRGDNVVTGVSKTPVMLLQPSKTPLSAADHLQTLSSGEVVVFGDEAGTIEVFLLHQSDAPLRPLASFHGHSAWITQVTAAPSIGGIYTSSIDGTLTLCDVAKQTVLQSLSPQPMADHSSKPIFNFDYCPYSNTLAYGLGRTVFVWSTLTAVCHTKLTDHTSLVTHVAVNTHCCNEIITLQDDKTIKIWDTRVWRVVDVLNETKLRRREKPFSVLGSIPERGLLLSGNRSLLGWRSIRAQELIDAGFTSPIAPPNVPLRGGTTQYSAVPSPVGNQSASVTSSRASPLVTPAGAEGPRQVRSFVRAHAPRHLQPIVAMHVALHSGLIVAVDTTKVIVWRAADLTPLSQWRLHCVPTAVAFDSSETRMLVGTDEGDVRWFNACSGYCIRCLSDRPTSRLCVAVGCITYIASFSVPVVAAGIGSRLLLWADLAEVSSPESAFDIPREYGAAVAVLHPVNRSAALLVATTSGVAFVYNSVTGAIMYSIPPPVSMCSAEAGFLLHSQAVVVAHANATMRFFAFERDTMCLSVAYFPAAARDDEHVTCVTTIATMHAFGDTCGRISLFRIGALGDRTRLAASVIPARAAGRATEDDIVAAHVELVSCWDAHTGAAVSGLGCIPGAESRLASSGADRAVRVWDVHNGWLIAEAGRLIPSPERIIGTFQGQGVDYAAHPFHRWAASGERARIDYSVRLPTPRSGGHSSAAPHLLLRDLPSFERKQSDRRRRRSTLPMEHPPTRSMPVRPSLFPPTTNTTDSVGSIGALPLLSEPRATTPSLTKQTMVSSEQSAYEMLCGLERRARLHSKRDLPEVDMPVTSEAVRLSLIDVERVRRARDRAPTDPLSNTGGFRSLFLPFPL